MKRTGFFSFTSAAVPVWSDITFIPLCLYCESILFSLIKRKRNVILKSTWIYVDTHIISASERKLILKSTWVLIRGRWSAMQRSKRKRGSVGKISRAKVYPTYIHESGNGAAWLFHGMALSS